MIKKEITNYIEKEKNVKIFHIQKNYQIKKNILENHFDIIKEKAQEIIGVAENLGGNESLTKVMKDILYHCPLAISQFGDLDSPVVIERAASLVAANYFGIMI